MKLRNIIYILFFAFCLFVGNLSVSAIVCKYNISGYTDDPIYWEVDSSKDKPADNVKIYNGIADAGREPILNWSESKIGTYRALDDIDNGKCPAYLIDSYSATTFVGHRTYLSDSNNLSAFYTSKEIQQYSYWGGLAWYDAEVIIYKLAENTKPEEVHTTCSYGSTDESYQFQLQYDSSGKLIGYSDKNKGPFMQPPYFSYTVYEEQTVAGNCNPNAYLCFSLTQQDAGFSRIYINSYGFKKEDETFSAESSWCVKYDYSKENSSSVGEMTNDGVCNIYDEIFTELDSYGKKLGECEKGSNDCANYASEFAKIELKLHTLCQSFYSTAYYSDSCVQKCTKLEKEISDLKENYNIDQIDPGNGNGCFLSKRITDWILKVIRWIRYIVPILLIILSILDFIKAIASDSEDEIKKVGAKFAKRLIAALLIFLVPLIIEFLLETFGLLTDSGFCI